MQLALWVLSIQLWKSSCEFKSVMVQVVFSFCSRLDTNPEHLKISETLSLCDQKCKYDHAKHVVVMSHMDGAQDQPKCLAKKKEDIVAVTKQKTKQVEKQDTESQNAKTLFS